MLAAQASRSAQRSARRAPKNEAFVAAMVLVRLLPREGMRYAREGVFRWRRPGGAGPLRRSAGLAGGDGTGTASAS